MMIHLLATVLSLSSFSDVVFAHGGDAPGPHGGYIQMPSSFHTEVLPGKGSSFQVFLIDMQFEKPTIQNSSVTAQIVRGEKTTALQCEAVHDHFACKGAKLNSGMLVLKATRDGVSAPVDAKYELPFKPFPTQKPKTSHH